MHPFSRLLHWQLLILTTVVAKVRITQNFTGLRILHRAIKEREESDARAAVQAFRKAEKLRAGMERMIKRDSACITRTKHTEDAYIADDDYCRSWSSKQLCAGEVWCTGCTARLCGGNKMCVEAKRLEEGLKKQRRQKHQCVWMVETAAPTSRPTPSPTLITLTIRSKVTHWEAAPSAAPTPAAVRVQWAPNWGPSRVPTTAPSSTPPTPAPTLSPAAAAKAMVCESELARVCPRVFIEFR
jgi:hypothetical protein